MRTLPEYQSERDELERMAPEPWMVEALKANPDYVFWGPHEDYMIVRGDGWNSPLSFESFDDMFSLDDYNEVVNFYFEINRDSEECSECLGTGHNKDVHELERSWYDFENTGKRWCDKIGQAEVDALWEQRRFMHEFPTKPTPEQVNVRERGRGMGHDAINRWICVEARAKQMGVWSDCPVCQKSGHVFVENNARLSLILWVLHPRKGASRGAKIRTIERSDLLKVMEFLRLAQGRNDDRFAGIGALEGAAK